MTVEWGKTIGALALVSNDGVFSVQVISQFVRSLLEGVVLVATSICSIFCIYHRLSGGSRTAVSSYLCLIMKSHAAYWSCLYIGPVIENSNRRSSRSGIDCFPQKTDPKYLQSKPNFSYLSLPSFPMLLSLLALTHPPASCISPPSHSFHHAPHPSQPLQSATTRHY